MPGVALNHGVEVVAKHAVGAAMDIEQQGYPRGNLDGRESSIPQSRRRRRS